MKAQEDINNNALPEGIKESMPFSVPENYFSDLPRRIADKCTKENKFNFINYFTSFVVKNTISTVSIAGIVVLLVSSYFIFRNITSENENPNYLANNNIALQSYKNADSSVKNDTATYEALLPDDKILINKNISTDEIINYLDSDPESDLYYNDLQTNNIIP